MTTRRPLLPAVLILGSALLAGFTVWQSLAWVEAAQLFPYYLGLATLALAAAALAEYLIGRALPEDNGANAADLGGDEDERTPAFRRAGLLLFGWVIGLCGLAALVGMLAATPVWTVMLLRLRYRAPWLVSGSIAAGLVALMLLLNHALMMRFPAGLLLG